MERRVERIALGGLFLGVVAVAALLVRPAQMLETVRHVADDTLLFGVILTGLFLVRPIFLWPTTPLAALVGYGFGITLGLPLALVGVLATVTPTYVAVRWLDGGATGGRVRGTVRRYFAATGPVRGVTAARLAPIPSDVTTAAAAVSGVRYRPFILGTAVGEFPWLVAAVLVGATAETVVTDGLGGVGLTVAVACSGAALVLLAGPAARWYGLNTSLGQ